MEKTCNNYRKENTSDMCTEALLNQADPRCRKADPYMRYKNLLSFNSMKSNIIRKLKTTRRPKKREKLI